MKKAAPKRLYFLAAIPPDPLQTEMMQLKRQAGERFGSYHSLNSPAHITLIPPFYATDEEIDNFIEALKKFVEAFSPLGLELKNFDKFGKRVIFVDVLPREEFNKFQQALFDFFKNHFPFYKKPNRFHPHITVAFKDLKEEIFQEAWDYFSSFNFEAHFLMDYVYLLKHENKKWHIVEKFPLKKD